MDKKELRTIPRPEPFTWAGESLAASDRVIVTRDIEAGGEPHLVMEIYRRMKGSRKMVCDRRVFFKADDYITQDLTTPKTKWLTGAVTNDWEFMHQTKKIFATDGDRERMAAFFREFKCKPTSWRQEPTIWDDLGVYSERILDARADVVHRKLEDKIDRKMEGIEDPPPAFSDWVHTDALRESQYIFYTKTEKKDRVTCRCTVCRETFEANRREIGAKHNQKGECPKCSASITFKAYGKLGRRFSDTIHAAYIDPTEDGYIARFFIARREYTKAPGGVKETDYFGEVVREFVTYKEGVKRAFNETYQYACFPWSNKLRWCTDRGSYGSSMYWCYSSCLYPGNLPEAWAHTPMRNSGLDILSRHTPGKPTRYWDVMMNPGEYRYVEILAKSGFYRMPIEKILSPYHSYGGGSGICFEGTDLKSVLRMNEKGDPKKGGVPNRLNIKILRSLDASERMLVLMQIFQRNRISVTADELVRYLNIFGLNRVLLEQRFRRASIHKMCKYIEDIKKKDKRRKLENIGDDWTEYLTWCDQLGIDLADPYHYFPPNFYEEHDRVAQLKKEHDDRVAAEEKRKREEAARKAMAQTAAAIAEIFKKNEGVDAFSIKGRGLLLIVPKDASEIKAEGEALHHCVGTYVDRVAKGETNIFFVRKAKEPDKSYFTMEWANGRVQQCRGKRNCDMPPDVKAFVQVFEKKMQEAEARKANMEQKEERRVS